MSKGSARGCIQHGHAPKVVTNHRLAHGSHSDVFPQHVGDMKGEGFHPSPRNGHGGSHTVTSKGRK